MSGLRGIRSSRQAGVTSPGRLPAVLGARTGVEDRRGELQPRPQVEVEVATADRQAVSA
jgi:hypothetical protein